MSKVITRFAPSPTGLLHAGNYRTAIFAYLYAKHENGLYVLRIEDTDTARSKPEFETNIKETLAWLELTADKTYRQSEHRTRHRKLLEELVSKGVAYVSKETPAAPGDREEVIRFKNPGGSVTFTDIIRGDITTDVTDLGDFIIARSFDEPVFHFAVVVDDADEGVTHAIRGGDHISNTARQMLIQHGLDLPTPIYAHLPLIFDTNHKKLSKRTGAKALTEYRDQGILPEALLNYLAFLGWNPGDNREYLTKTELIETFDLARVQKGSAVFDEIKLLSVNQHWMRELGSEAFISHLKSRGSLSLDVLTKAVPLLKERTHSFAEADEMLSGELACLFKALPIQKSVLLAKEPATRRGMTKSALESLQEALRPLSGGVSAEQVKKVLMPIADAEEARGKGGRGAVLWPLRYALSGQERSPDPFTLISIIGLHESEKRIREAIAIIA